MQPARAAPQAFNIITPEQVDKLEGQFCCRKVTLTGLGCLCCLCTCPIFCIFKSVIECMYCYNPVESAATRPEKRCIGSLLETPPMHTTDLWLQIFHPGIVYYSCCLNKNMYYTAPEREIMSVRS